MSIHTLLLINNKLVKLVTHIMPHIDLMKIKNKEIVLIAREHENLGCYLLSNEYFED